MIYEFLPTSVFPRLLVQLSSDVDVNLAWRDGCVLRDDTFGATAVAKVDRNAKSIDVFVSGNQRREYFSIIRKALLDVSLRPTSLNFKETVPCICADCRAKRAPFFYDYSYLLQRKRKGKDTVDCQISVETISIQELLEGIETSPTEEVGWDVFVSYSSRDADVISNVVNDLERQQARVWWDGHQIKSGDSITRKIEMGLRTSRFIMPCLSRNQLKSGWCRAEYAGVLHKVLGGHTSKRVTPLIIDDLPDNYVPYLFSDFRSERLSNSRGYKHLLSYIAGRDSATE
jgi:hypothetical protein